MATCRGLPWAPGQGGSLAFQGRIRVSSCPGQPQDRVTPLDISFCISTARSDLWVSSVSLIIRCKSVASRFHVRDYVMPRKGKQQLKVPGSEPGSATGCGTWGPSPGDPLSFRERSKVAISNFRRRAHQERVSVSRSQAIRWSPRKSQPSGPPLAWGTGKATWTAPGVELGQLQPP